MSQNTQKPDPQKDKNALDKNRPSQAEGDRKTIEQDLADKEKKKTGSAGR